MVWCKVLCIGVQALEKLREGVRDEVEGHHKALQVLLPALG